MGLDIRWPIGLMFSLIGAMMAGYGVLNSAASMSKATEDQGINIDLVWGVVLLVFGVLMLLGAMKGRKEDGK